MVSAGTVCVSPSSLQDHAILLPIYAQMTEDDRVRVADALRAELS